MIISLRFKIPVEQEEYEMAYKGAHYKYALDELDNYLRGVIKYNENYADTQLEIFQLIRDKLSELVNNCD